MTDYEDDFERESNHSESKHLLKLSLDILNVKDMTMSSNLIVSYNITLL